MSSPFVWILNAHAKMIWSYMLPRCQSLSAMDCSPSRRRFACSKANNCRAWPWRCSMNELVERVNKLLLAGEPGNITKADTNGYVGYEPQAIIDSMNEGFGIGNWGFEELSSETVDNEKGTLAVAQVRVWLKDIDFKPFAWGQSRVTRGDTGDAKKDAQTDAITNALAYFSIGNRAYHGLLDKKPGNSQRTTQQSSKPATPAPVVEAAQANGHQEQPALTLADVQERAVATGVAKSR